MFRIIYSINTARTLPLSNYGEFEMEMICRTKISKDLGDGVWVSDLDGKSLSIFGKPHSSGGKRTILSVQVQPRIIDNDHLEFDIQDVILMNHGDGVAALIVSLAYGETKIQPESDYSGNAGNNRDRMDALGDYREGVEMFLKACTKENMPVEKSEFAREFLRGVRKFSDDELVEGKARKWVTKPNNFLAITIQNRKQNFAIHVKKTSVLSNLHSLDIRDDRPGYARFWLEGRWQIDDALAAARASFDK